MIKITQEAQLLRMGAAHGRCRVICQGLFLPRCVQGLRISVTPDVVPLLLPVLQEKADVRIVRCVGLAVESNGAFPAAVARRTLHVDMGNIHFNFCELIFDVNSAYFYNHGGYEFAKQFYADAYEAAVKIIGGEQYILSAVMHADERNRAMADALGQDVFHYHLHVVYVPVVEKQILWSKRCKDPALVGTVKETIMQVSGSKKWASQPAKDEQGIPGQPVLKPSYSMLQDDFFNAMWAAGYDDVERGQQGSTEEHLTVTQFNVQQEQQRLAKVQAEIAASQQEIAQLDDERTQAIEDTRAGITCGSIAPRCLIS